MGELVVADVMSTSLKMVPANISAFDAARLMAAADVSEVVVVADGRVSGVVTGQDIAVRVIAAGRSPFTTLVSEIGTQQLVSIEDREPIDSAVRLMRRYGVQRLLVGDRDRSLIGMLHAADLALCERRSMTTISAEQAVNAQPVLASSVRQT